jgi:hypothetical protein
MAREEDMSGQAEPRKIFSLIYALIDLPLTGEFRKRPLLNGYESIKIACRPFHKIATKRSRSPDAPEARHECASKNAAGCISIIMELVRLEEARR